MAQPDGADRTRRSNGESSIKFDAQDGRWHAWVSMGRRADGKYDRKHIAVRPEGTSERAVEAARKQLLRDIKELERQRDAGIRRDATVTTVGEWVRTYLDTVAIRKVRATTWERYDSLVRNQIIPTLGHIPLEKLEPEHVEAAYTRWEQTLSGSSVLQAHRVLSRALKVAVQRRRISRNVCTLVDAPSNKDRKRARPLSLPEAQQLLAVAADRRNGVRWLLALALGIRQGEALGLTWDAVDLDVGVVYIHRSLQRHRGKGLVLDTVKSRSAVRALALDPAIVEAMRAHQHNQLAEQMTAGSEWRNPHQLVFTQVNGRAIDPRRDWAEWREILTAAGLDVRGTHAARHTAASLMARSHVHVAEAKEILGHSQVALTIDVYTHVDPQQSREALAKVSGALFPAPLRADPVALN